MNVTSLDGQVCVVTGGGSGIGRAIAESFIAAGARVVITGRNEERLTAAAAELGERAVPIVHDVSDLPSIPTFVQRVEREVGPIATLVNNAGVHLKGPTVEVSDDEVAQILLVNSRAVFGLSRAVAARMITRRIGNIQMVGSMAALFGIPYVAAYTMAKSAVTGLVRQLAVEWGPSNVRVNAIAPGFIDTDMSRKALGQDPERKRKVLSRTPLDRLGRPEEIGGVSVFLASPAASFVTGVTLAVDGGASIGF